MLSQWPTADCVAMRRDRTRRFGCPGETDGRAGDRTYPRRRTSVYTDVFVLLSTESFVSVNDIFFRLNILRLPFGRHVCRRVNIYVIITDVIIRPPLALLFSSSLSSCCCRRCSRFTTLDLHPFKDRLSILKFPAFPTFSFQILSAFEVFFFFFSFFFHKQISIAKHFSGRVVHAFNVPKWTHG